jgi:arginyl-tRNA synthetase
VAAVAPEVGEEASVHLGYEMVALSIAACDELGIKLRDEDRSRPFVEMSGRKGLGVKADDLIDRLERDALTEVEARHPDVSDEERRETAHIIAVGALRYFLLKFTRNSVIAFDFKEALSFEGETGPYCQYSAVRANSIFRKLDAEAARDAGARIRALESGDTAVREEVASILSGESGDEIWGLVTLAARLDEAISQAVSAAEPSLVAKYTFNLARAFNLFYHRHRIIAEENANRRAVLVAVADIARRQLTLALSTLGIHVPERM